MTGLLYGTTLATVLACGLSAGVFFAFSAFVMPALDRLDSGASIAAMQAINVKAVTPAFMVVLMGGGLLCVVLLVVALRSWGDASSPWLAAGAGVFLVGVLGLTIGRHVPLNDALATVDAQASGAATRWHDYTGSWTPLNHVRAAAGAVATGLLVVGMTVA
ncbi:anthrone oxygenase family protein [Patulibacter sp. NPDC049589]|uniref:anthrone oxygenase family protein n=1 Tax=Patulibacter sp. NPDC049589 TaxID=3154731 RepID=UPI003427F461